MTETEKAALAAFAEYYKFDDAMRLARIRWNNIARKVGNREADIHDPEYGAARADYDTYRDAAFDAKMKADALWTNAGY